MVYLVSVYFVIHSLRIVTAPQSYYKLYVLNTSSLINNKFTNKHALLNRNTASLQSNGYDNYQKYIHIHDHFDKCTWWYTNQDDVTLQWEAAICISYEWMQIPFTTLFTSKRCFWMARSRWISNTLKCTCKRVMMLEMNYTLYNWINNTVQGMY